MGLLDKAKDAAATAADKAKEGAGKAKEKAGDVQAKRRADDLAKQLGYLIHAERTGGPAAGDQADALIAQITELQTQTSD